MSRQRKIVQIQAVSVPNIESTQCYAFLYALCDDGTTWFRRDRDTDWYPEPSVPGATNTAEENLQQTTNNESDAIVALRDIVAVYDKGGDIDLVGAINYGRVVLQQHTVS